MKKASSFQSNVLRNFSNASTSYDLASSTHDLIACDLISIVQTHVINPAKVFEMGCGTGVLTKKLILGYPDADFIINDLSSNMISATANNIHCDRNVSFVCANAEMLSFSDYCDADLFISSMSMQWLSDIDQFINKISKYFKNIAFAISTLPTFKTWYEICESNQIHINDMHMSQEYLLDICKKNGRILYASSKNYQMEFENVMEFLIYLKKIGANAHNDDKRCDLLRIVKNFKQNIKTEYCVFFVVLRSESN